MTQDQQSEASHVRRFGETISDSAEWFWRAIERSKESPVITALVTGTAGVLVLLFAAGMMWPLDRRIIDYYPGDVADFLLAAKSVIQGERLNIDLLTPIGPGFFYPIILGMKWFGGGAAAINFSIFLTGGAMAVLSTAAAPGRLSFLSGVVFAMTSVLIVVQPVNLGDNFNWLSVAMEYNKSGFAATLILFVVLCLPSPSWRGAKIAETSLIFAILMFCFFSKISYFIVGATASAMSVVIRQRDARWTPISALVAAVACIAVLLPWDRAYLHDIVFSGFQSGKARTDIYMFIDLALNNAYVVVLGLIAVFFSAAFVPRNGNSITYYAVVLAMILGGGFASLSQNSQRLLVPSAFALFVVMFETTIAPLSKMGFQLVGASSNQRTRLPLLRVISVILLIWYPVIIGCYGGMALSKYAGLSRNITAYRSEIPLGNATQGLLFDNRAASRFLSKIDRVAKYVPGDASDSQYAFIDNPGAWFAIIANARELVKQQQITSGSVLTFDTVNGPALLPGLKAAAPWHLWVHPTFRPIDADTVFRSADLVFLPHYPSPSATFARMMEIYGATLRARYRTIAQSQYWTLCRRTDEVSAAAGTQPCELMGGE